MPWFPWLGWVAIVVTVFLLLCLYACLWVARRAEDEAELDAPREGRWKW
jgi:cbb3-type cytochrome oxidase subunit 3